MTIQQVKEEAKKRFDKDLTDEEAQKWLEAHPAGELQDEELADVAGGGCEIGGEHEYDADGVAKNNEWTMKDCPRCFYNKHRRVENAPNLLICDKCGLRWDKFRGWEDW